MYKIPIYSKSRLVLVFSVFISLYLLLALNLYKIQILQADFFKLCATNQYQVSITTTPARAEIYDINNIPIALNKESLSAFIMPLKLQEPEKISEFLLKNFPKLYEKLETYKNNNSKNHFMYLKRHLSQEQLEFFKKAQLEDIQYLKEPSRYYPIIGLGQIIGLTNPDNQGLFGLELIYDKQLSGIPTTISLQKDARSGYFYFNQICQNQGLQGKSLNLTIDSTLQFLVYEQLKETISEVQAEEGSVVILDPETGELIVMAHVPDFDYNFPADKQITKNNIICDTYEFGSVIKIFCALAAIEENVVKADELIDCENKQATILNGFGFSTHQPHGIISFSEVIEKSNNIGTAKVALRLKSLLYEHYKRLGFGEKIGIFSGESPGYIIPISKWTNGTPIVLSFGYSITSTLLQLAQAMTVIANGGCLAKPVLVKQPNYNANKKGPLYKKDTIEVIREILTKTVNNGTAHRAKINGYSVMGKTGTARLLTGGKYDSNRSLFTFVGLIEKGNYKRIVITFIKESKIKNAYASTIAVPLFEKVAHKMLIHDKIL